MIELLILLIVMLLFRAKGIDRDALYIFAAFTVLYLNLPTGDGLASFVVAGCIDGAIILAIYLLPKITPMAKHLATISALSILINLCGAAGLPVNAAYTLLYAVALYLVATGTGDGLRKSASHPDAVGYWIKHN